MSHRRTLDPIPSPANPMRSVLEAFRHAFLGGGTVTAGQLAYRAGVTALILLIGILLFNRVERTFMDTM